MITSGSPSIYLLLLLYIIANVSLIGTLPKDCSTNSIFDIVFLKSFMIVSHLGKSPKIKSVLVENLRVQLLVEAFLGMVELFSPGCFLANLSVGDSV